jgi:hypothetical protein
MSGVAMTEFFRGWSSKLAAAAILAAPILAPMPVWATTYVYDQTSASVAGLMISASITVDGSLANLPDTSSTANPIDFGKLQAFAISAPGALARPYALSDFMASRTIPPEVGYPSWAISGGPDISFINDVDTDQFIITGGSIAINSDYELICRVSGECTAQGNWDPVPEPSTLAMLAIGLTWLGAAGVHLRRSSAI